MKKIAFLLLTAILFAGCYSGDIDDLNHRLDELKKEQERQAELLATYKLLIDALENKLTVTEVVETENGYEIVLSNGDKMIVQNGVNGIDGTDGQTPTVEVGENGNWFVNGEDTGIKAEGTDSPAIICVVDIDDMVTFYLSDGTTVSLQKMTVAGAYVLSEGNWGASDGQLAYFDYNAATKKYTRDDSRTQKNFGDTPNDLIVYGSKMYCAVTGASEDNASLKVIDRASGQTLETLTINHQSEKQQPRRLIAHGGHVYASLYSGALAKIDTLNHTVTTTALNGTFSDGLCEYDGNIYVCNSGQGEGKTLSVVSVSSFSETTTITVPQNPVNIVSTGTGELYINTLAIWTGEQAGTGANLHVYNVATKQITTLDLPVESITLGKEYIYCAATDWNSAYYDGILKKVKIADKSVSEFTDDIDEVILASKITTNPYNGEVFVTQQMGQNIYRFKPDGTLIETLKTGQQNGSAVVFDLAGK